MRVRARTIPIPGLHPDLEGLRIALLSDFHAGRVTPDIVVDRAIDRARQARPDLVALAGDFVDRGPDTLQHLLHRLASLRPPLGTYAVPGNHDRTHVPDLAWRRTLRDTHGVTDLTNRFVLLGVGKAALCIAGVDDLEDGRPHLHLPPPDQRHLTILLAHNPDHAERTRRHDDAVDLVLSGHTHGGQIRMPPVGPLHRKSDRYDHGLHHRPWTRVFTSRGIGTTLLPIRFGAPPEVALLTLTGDAHRG